MERDDMGSERNWEWRGPLTEGVMREKREFWKKVGDEI